jgi:hypothetical protein
MHLVPGARSFLSAFSDSEKPTAEVGVFPFSIVRR